MGVECDRDEASVCFGQLIYCCRLLLVGRLYHILIDPYSKATFVLGNERLGQARTERRAEPSLLKTPKRLLHMVTEVDRNSNDLL